MLTFTSVYIAAIAVFLAVIIVTDDPDRDRNSHTGPRIALSRAAEDLVPTENGFRLPSDGGFAALASRNPAIWLIGQSGDRSFSFGPVPESVARALEKHGPLIESGRFYVPGVERPLANAVVERRRIASGPLLLAAGGVDPKTLGSGDSLGASWGEGVLVILFWIAVVGFAAMLIALPILSRALRPLAAQAASILPQEPERRLDEERAPRELLPLVRGFNAALDRLASELGRRKRFIADAAHELRTPLAVVALRVEALEDETDKQELRRGLGRLVHLVSQMLDVERLSLSGRERSLVDLAAIARDVVADLAPTAIKSGYDLSLEAPDTPVVVTGDAHAISRAITNLVGNSVAHGGGTGQIRVAVGADRTIDVTDEGPGVPAALQPRLFEPFSRGSSNAEGCGLGLHLTREIMRAHGGEVRLVPSRRGATFRLRFESPDVESRP
ncbi:MAG TPA: HAMP domain-containing sensor histidine kinase [Allosphingosinicella sp.]|nr:HAMP domain-containing sensor histidine kinase [Allosphingosinicella sp.]